MPQRETAWTSAMRTFLENEHKRDPEKWFTVDSVLEIGMAAVPEDEAAKEAGKKSSRLSEERRLQVGRRAKAQQGLVGLGRFGKLRRGVDGSGKKTIQFLGNKSADLGEIVELRDRVRVLEDSLEAVVSQIQFLMDRATGETGETDASAVEFLESVLGVKVAGAED